MHNKNGGDENDWSVARLQDNRFMLMSPSIQQMKSYAWMRHQLIQLGFEDSVYLQDVTSLYTSLCIMGPKSKETLGKLTDVDLSTTNFPYFTCRHMDVSCSPEILTMNMTHTGEQGYVLYIPNEFAVEIYDSILEAGQEYGIMNCGYFAMRALRIEKFYAFWGQDIDSYTTPMESGRNFRTKVKKNIDFIGGQVIAEEDKRGVGKKTLALFLVDNQDHDSDVDPWPWGGEPIFRDGVFVGSVTTCSYGFSLNKHVGLCYVTNPDEPFTDQKFVRQGNYEIEIAGTRYPIKVRLTPPTLPALGDAPLDTNAQYRATRHFDEN